MKRKLILHGPLRKLHPTGILELDSDTVGEALNGMSKQLGLKPDIWTGRPMYKVLGCDTTESIVGENHQAELHVVPAFVGSGGDVFKIIIGAILVVVGIATGNATLIMAGAGLIIGGLINLLFPTKQESATTQNHYLQASGNTTAIGTRISLLFGEVQAFGQVLSYNVDSSAITGGTGSGGNPGPGGPNTVVYA